MDATHSNHRSGISHNCAQIKASTSLYTSGSRRICPSCEAHSYPPNHGLPGMEPKQPNPPKTTASSARPPTTARRRCYPRASPPPQHAHQLQESRATRAGSLHFISSPTLPHQHHAQPRAAARFLQNARAVICKGVCACIGSLIKVCEGDLNCAIAVLP